MAIQWSNIWNTFKSQLSEKLDSLDENNNLINNTIGSMLPYKEVFRCQAIKSSDMKSYDFSLPDNIGGFEDVDAILMYSPGGSIKVTRSKKYKGVTDTLIMYDGNDNNYLYRRISDSVISGWGSDVLSTSIDVQKFNYLFSKKLSGIAYTSGKYDITKSGENSIELIRIQSTVSYGTGTDTTYDFSSLPIYVIGYKLDVDTTKIEG